MDGRGLVEDINVVDDKRESGNWAREVDAR